MAELVVKSGTVADATFSALGTTVWNAGMSPSSGQLSAAFGGTGISSLAAGIATWLGSATAADLRTATNGTTGTAGNLVFSGAPTLTTPDIGTPSAGVLTNTTGYTLNAIAAATAAVTIASGNNTGIVWNWRNTTDSTVCHTFGETTASTNGTSTSGVPNQVLLKLITVAASTQSPLSVYVRGTHAFSVAPDLPQILGAPGVTANPTYSFAASTNTGMFGGSSALGFVVNGTLNFQVTATQIWCAASNSFSAPAIADNGATNNGIALGSSLVGVAFAGIENSQWIAGGYRLSKGTADAVSYAMNFRKSRGTVASPTVITTGDDLATFSGFGYVGATNTYQEACRITFDSTGTISDSTTGIGGIITFAHATVGAEPVTVAQLKSQHLVHSGTAPTITAGGGTNPTIVGTDEAFVVTVGTGGVATSVEVTFGNAFTTNPPVCIAESDTDLVPFKNVSLVNKVTISATLAFTAGSKIVCISRGWE